jgi:hypothetical protein
MKVIRVASGIVIGIVFIFSGLVKAIDPLGSAYKFHDYFQAFDLSFLFPLCLPLAITLFTVEFIAGFSVLTGIMQKKGISVVMLLMVIFTPLTLILALTNPVSDCGCFGDAIHLTNWQTFWKNLILITLSIILYTNRKEIKQSFKVVTDWIIITIAILFIILFSVFNLTYLPVIDFLPYKTGTNIAEKMVIPEGVAADKYETTFIYEKDGVQKEFTLNNYPANDSTWVFIDQKSVLVSKGYQPPIHDFRINSQNGEDITSQILSYSGYSLLMISRKLEEAGIKNLSTGFELGKYCMQKGINFYILTASGTDEVKNYDNALPFNSADETTLKTMVRSNPGYIFLKNGIITNKWSWANIPDQDWFDKILTHSSSN